jgi:hypothetical protein
LGSRTRCRPLTDYDMAAGADLVIDEPSSLQFRYRNDLLTALNRPACGRLDKYQMFVALGSSRNDMFNLLASASWQGCLCKHCHRKRGVNWRT